MIPIVWRALKVDRSKRCRSGFWLIATEQVHPFRQDRRYYGHITIGHMDDECLMLLMRDDCARMIEGFKS